MGHGLLAQGAQAGEITGLARSLQERGVGGDAMEQARRQPLPPVGGIGGIEIKTQRHDQAS
jgi:hypothetical protein